MGKTENSSAPRSMPTRRQWIAGGAIACGGLGLGSPMTWAAADEEISRTEEAIHQQAMFKATRKRVYDALMDAKQFQQVMERSAAMKSGMVLGNLRTEISSDVGGAFTIYGGHILGRNVELVPGERIVQAWRVADWNPGAYSLAKFELLEQGSETKLVFDHTGFPRGDAEHLAAGWKANYWEPLAKFLA
jgi:activator of HSP90 ATPase